MTDLAVINDDDLQTMFREGSSKASRRYSDSKKSKPPWQGMTELQDFSDDSNLTLASQSIRSVMTFSQSLREILRFRPCRSFNSLAGCVTAGDSGLIMWSPLKKTACSTVKGEWVRESCHNMPFHVHNITSKWIKPHIIRYYKHLLIGYFREF